MMEPICLYVHIPFCSRKCSYCDFYSVVPRPDDFSDYVKALVLEAAREGDTLSHPAVSTVYLGGGTPSLLSPLMVEEILDAIYRSFKVADGAEITMEANPGTVSYPVWKNYINLGVNRISLGVQSLDENMLRVLGRLHSVEDVYGAVTSLRRMGFYNYNIDLIYGIPGQTTTSLARELVLLKNFLGTHLSAYSLQLEENTPLARQVREGFLAKPNEDTEAAMYEMIGEMAEGAGLSQYELSNWAKPGFECRHNLAYWEMRPYMGLGAGAVSRLGNIRYQNKPDLKSYIESVKNGQPEREILEEMSEQEMVRETMIMGLRLTRGVSLSDFQARFGRPVDFYYGDVIAEAQKEGLLVTDDGYLRLDPQAYLVANQVLCRF